MPHLQFELNKALTDDHKRQLAAEVKCLFARIMDTGTDHIATTIREYGTYNLDLGRVTDHTKGVALVNADLRQGRTLQQRRDLALGFIEILGRLFGVPGEHVYVTFTEHKGEDFHLNERYLVDWAEGEEEP